MADIQSLTAEIRRGKKERKKKIENKRHDLLIFRMIQVI